MSGAGADKVQGTYRLERLRRMCNAKCRSGRFLSVALIVGLLTVNGLMAVAAAVPAGSETRISMTSLPSMATSAVTGPSDAAPAPGSSAGIASVPNLRDIGGYTTSNGQVVRYGVAYRSDQLNPVTAADMNKLAALNLKNDFDLRTEEERNERPDEVPAGTDQVWLNVLADARGTSATEVDALLEDPQQANSVLRGGKADAAMVEVYREFVTLPSALTAYRQLFVALESPDALPSLFHCTTGKDRTGWAAAALLTLLGVPADQVYGDFLRSNDYILPAYQPLIDSFTESGGEREIAEAIIGVKPEYLHASFDEMETKYGPIEAYFADGLGIDAAGQQQLRDRFLTVK
jgi:protein-tyrosine phosphatase